LSDYRSPSAGEWHIKLRQVRNNPSWPLFEQLSWQPLADRLLELVGTFLGDIEKLGELVGVPQETREDLRQALSALEQVEEALCPAATPAARPAAGTPPSRPAGTAR
jgi:hypothetical protein